MIIQIDGTGTVNKGAELMLYAILEEIEQKQPKAKVLFNKPDDSVKNIQSKLNVTQPARFNFRFNKFVRSIINRLNLVYFTSYYPGKNINVLFDGSGFRFGDQWGLSERKLKILNHYYKRLKQNGTKIIFLSQALGPFETKSGKEYVAILNKYADLIIVRDQVSLDYFLKASGDESKTYLFPDFTARVKGHFPEKHSSLKGSVCIIPNKKMIKQTSLSQEQYLASLEEIIRRILQSGYQAFILNHEGKSDLEICHKLNNRFNNELNLVTDLNAKEIKGMIGNALFVISGRYHGVASALNQGVPCLATSWSHKYEALFKDFGLTDCIIDLETDTGKTLNKIDNSLKPDNIANTKNTITANKGEVYAQIDLMWEKVWSLIS